MAFFSQLMSPMGLLQGALSLPAFLGSLYSMQQSAEMAEKWKKETKPQKYATRGWSLPQSMQTGEQPIPARTDTGLADFLSGYGIKQPNPREAKAALR